jgi:hypothetical protein
VFIEIDDGQKIGRKTRLISSPDIKRLRGSFVAVMAVMRERQAGEPRKQQAPNPRPNGERPFIAGFHDLTPDRLFKSLVFWRTFRPISAAHQ